MTMVVKAAVLLAAMVDAVAAPAAMVVAVQAMVVAPVLAMVAFVAAARMAFEVVAPAAAMVAAVLAMVVAPVAAMVAFVVVGSTEAALARVAAAMKVVAAAAMDPSPPKGSGMTHKACLGLGNCPVGSHNHHSPHMREHFEAAVAEAAPVEVGCYQCRSGPRRPLHWLRTKKHFILCNKLI